MEHAEGGHSTDERKVPDTDNDGDVFNASGSLQPGRGAIVSGMLSLSVGRTVTFNDSVAVYTPTDWSPSVYREARKDRGCNRRSIEADFDGELSRLNWR
jgi:hypothetical protein